MATAFTPSEKQTKRPVRAVIPFLTTSFAKDLRLYLYLWPVWWALGIEQLLFPFFIAWETARLLIRRRGKFSITWPVIWAFLLAVWTIVPIVWVDREQLDIFLKDISTFFSMMFMLLVFWNTVRTKEDWHFVIQGISALAVYIVIGGFLFILGIGRQPFSSVLGQILPGALVGSSAFFTSISLRTFGGIESLGDLSAIRLTSISLRSSGLSLLTLLLFPFELWRMQYAKGRRRLFHGLLAASLFACLFLTLSRTAYIALICGFALWVILNFEMLNSKNWPLFVALVLVGTALILLGGYILLEDISGASQLFITDLRPGSWVVRLRIYTESLKLLPEHPIAGWGRSVRIEGSKTVYSAGTHSAPLAMLFQRGVVGLFFYLALWLSIWRTAIKGYKRRKLAFPNRAFWSMILAAIFAFNVREIADVWWWDQTITIVLWSIWGLIITAYRLFPQSGVQKSL